MSHAEKVRLAEAIKKLNRLLQEKAKLPVPEADHESTDVEREQANRHSEPGR